jgi:hypothetical protein
MIVTISIKDYRRIEFMSWTVKKLHQIERCSGKGGHVGCYQASPTKLARTAFTRDPH